METGSEDEAPVHPCDWKTVAQLVNLLKDSGAECLPDIEDVRAYAAQRLASSEVLKSCFTSQPSGVIVAILSLTADTIDLGAVVMAVTERYVRNPVLLSNVSASHKLWLHTVP